MAERRDEVTPRSWADDPLSDQPTQGDTGYTAGETTYTSDSSDLTAESSDTQTKSTEEIEREIERTRAGMSNTIEQIQERFSPQYIRRQITEEVKETARGAGVSMVETIKQNPLPAAIAGLSIAWLFYNGRQSQNRYSGNYRAYDSRRGGYGAEYGRSEYDTRYAGAGDYGSRYYSEPYGRQGYYGATEESGTSVKDRVRDVGQDVRQRASEVTHDVRHRAGEFTQDVQERASELGQEVNQRIEAIGNTVQHQAYRVRNSFERMLDENPLAVGAMALGVGAVLGLMLPSTDLEDEWMGSARDRVVETVQEKAEDTLDKAEQVAGKAAETIKDELKSTAEKVTSVAKDEAQKQGLMHNS